MTFKSKTSSHLIVSCLLVLMAFSCKKDKSAESENTGWKLVSEITNDGKNASYCFSDGQTLMVRSLNQCYLFDQNHHLTESILLNNSPDFAYQVFPMVDNLIINIPNPGNLEVLCTDISNTVNNFGYYFGNSDSNILSLHPKGELTFEYAYILSEFKRILFKVSDKRGSNYSRLVMADIQGLSPQISIDLPGHIEETYLHFYDSGKFYFSDNTTGKKALYELDLFGHFTKISDFTFYTMCKSNGLYYGITPYHEFYVSSDRGRSWTKTNLELSGFNLLMAGDKVLLTLEDHISELHFNGMNSAYVNINNHGLEGNKITWLCKHQDRYYCTTKSGVFYIEEKYFKGM